MYLSYHPEGSEQPTIFKYEPKRLMSAEREMLEKRTGLTYEKFHQNLLEGSSTCRRALLFMFLKRTAPGTRYEDVDFAWGECDLGLYKHEIEEFIAKVPETNGLSESEKERALAELNDQLAEAPEDDDSGKAPSRS